jgi:hypothetical protein
MSDDLKKPGTPADDTKDEDKVDAPLATMSEVFSFAETFKTKLYLAMGIFWAVVAGLALPASLLYFSKIMGDISAIAAEGLDPVVDIVYSMMILGVISLISETLQSKLYDGLCRDDCIIRDHWGFFLTHRACSKFPSDRWLFGYGGR